MPDPPAVQNMDFTKTSTVAGIHTSDLVALS